MTEETTGSTWSYPLGLFEGYGIEIEYMIVDRETLDVRPVADALFRLAAGHDTEDVEPDGPDGATAWSNELALHVAEIKTNGPAPALEGVAAAFQDSVDRMNAYLADLGCRLLPTGMHPWMDPDRETRLWPHEYNEVYSTYDRIFSCRGHGWGNLQSTHINLPFANDEELGRLHAAIRAVLPLIPALAASSPYVEGLRSPLADHRLEVYRNNAARVPLMTGLVVPEPVFTRAEYEELILGRLWDQLGPLDPEGILREEWANARGCIARFDRGALEIRIVDNQECPRADIALVALICEVVRALVEERWSSGARQRALATEPLHRVLLDTIRDAEDALVEDPALLAVFDVAGPRRAGEIWRLLFDRVIGADHHARADLEPLLAAGTLATRIRKAVGEANDRDRLKAVYVELADCLATGTLFRVGT